MPCSLQQVLKAVQVVVGVCVVVVGIYNFSSGSLFDFQFVVLNTGNIVFGLLLALAGLLGAAATPILKYFAFLGNWFGIGAFQLWLGALCVGAWDWSRLTTWIGLVAMVTGTQKAEAAACFIALAGGLACVHFNLSHTHCSHPSTSSLSPTLLSPTLPCFDTFHPPYTPQAFWKW